MKGKKSKPDVPLLLKVTETYSFTSAVNLSSDENTYYFIYEQGEYLIIINQHISLWKKTEGKLELISNILHLYNSPNRNVEVFEGKYKITSEDDCPVEILDNYGTFIFGSLGFGDITDLRFKRVLNLSVPAPVIEWESTTSKAIQKFNELHVLRNNNFEEAIVFQHELLDYLFEEPDLNMTKHYIEIIENLYREKMGTGIDRVFL